MTMIRHREAINRGFGEQVRRDKLARQDLEEVELIVRVTFKATRRSHAENMLNSGISRHPNILSYEIIEGVVDKARLEDAQALIETIGNQRDLNIWENALNAPGRDTMNRVRENDNGEGLPELWTRKQMANYHKVSAATVSRWLYRNPIPEEIKNGAQYQIPAGLARSYQPRKFKVGRKRKES